MCKLASADKVARTALVVLLQMTVASSLVLSGSLAAQEGKLGNPGVSAQTTDQQQLYAGVQDAIYKDRHQLLAFLGDRKTRAAVCTPAPSESYDQFQESIQEKLDVLWNLDIYAVKYGLTEKQHRDVKACAAEMERYQDNFKLWQQLNRAH